MEDSGIPTDAETSIAINRLRSMVEDLKAVREYEARLLDSQLSSDAIEPAKAHTKAAGSS